MDKHKRFLLSALDFVYQDLREKIQTGRLEPGAKLDINVIAKELGVSRTPVREALQRLEIEGLVTIEPRRYTKVSRISLNDMLNLYEVRISVETLACSHILQNITAADVQSLEQLLAIARRQLEDNQFVEYRDTNYEYHDTLYHAVRNPYLEEVLIHLRDLSWRYVATAIKVKKQLRQSLRNHVEIVEAIKARDLERLQRAIVQDLRATVDAVKMSKEQLALVSEGVATEAK